MYTGLLAAAVSLTAPAARAGETATLPGHVAGFVSASERVGSAADTQIVSIAVRMAPRSPAALKAFVAEVSDPRSEHYGQYLSAREFTERFGPAAADAEAVKELLLRAGMKEIEIGAGGMYVSAAATVKQLRDTFKVSQDTYAHNGMVLRANREAPTIPAALAGKILSVSGLDDTAFLKRPVYHSATAREAAPEALPARPEGTFAAQPSARAPAAAVIPPPVAASLPSPYCSTYFGDADATLSTAPAPYAGVLPWLACGYTPQDVRAAYGFDKVKKYDGTGVTVAIIDAYASPTLKYDGNRYAGFHGLPRLTAANFTQIIPEGIYNVSPTEACGPQGWFTEQSLDLASVHGTAPGAHIVYIGARDCGTSLDIALVNAVYNHYADVITNSYGYGGEAVPAAQVAADDAAYAMSAAMGITILFSSGDSGDLSLANGVASGSWPTDSVYVTGVGGTTLELSSPKGAKTEYGWGTYRGFLNGVTVNSVGSVTDTGFGTTTAFGLTFPTTSFYAGSGGGISLIEAQPSYQAGVVPTALSETLNEGSGYTVPLGSPHRVSPDVAMLADPYTGYLYGETYTIAGNPLSDSGCGPISPTEEYCENPIGGTSLASPLMAGAIAVWNQARLARGEPVVGFANPMLYSLGTSNSGSLRSSALNQILPPAAPTAMLRGYSNNPAELRVITVNSVPTLIDTTPSSPYNIEVCGLPICEGVDEIYNYTGPTYNDVTGLGVPYLPYLVQQ